MQAHPSSSQGMPPLRAAKRIQTAVILSVAAMLRMLVVWSVAAHRPASWFFSRGMEMGLLAVSLLSGHGLGSPFGTPTGPTAFIAPGYPILVAGVFRVLGSYTTAASVFLMTAQVGINVLTVWLIVRVSRSLGGLRAAWVAGLLWACSPPLWWIPTIFWDTSLSACIMAGLVAFGLRFRTRFGRKTAILNGAACGLAALLNPALLLVLIATTGWMAFDKSRRERFRVVPLALACCAFVVVFSPWPIRNARVFHAFIPLRTTVGFELWMGNHEGATGFLNESLFPMFNERELADYKARGEVGYTANKSKLAEAYIAEHPGVFLRVTALRVKRFWTGTGSQGGSALFAVHAYVTSLLGLCGLFILFRRAGPRAGLLFALPLLLFPFPYYITHAEFRYRLVIDPLLTMLSGYAVAAVARKRAGTAASSEAGREGRQASIA